MSIMITRDYQCNQCFKQWYTTLLRENQDKLQTCPSCGSLESGERIMSAPTVLRASYLDGQSRGEGYEKMKRAAKLEGEMMNKPVEERKEIKKEIDKLKKT